MTAAFLCGLSGIERQTLENSTAYLQTWISRLKSDSKLILSAASGAQKASDYIAGSSLADHAESEFRSETEQEREAA